MLLQKRNYETFSDADFDDCCAQVEEENIEEDEEEMIGASFFFVLKFVEEAIANSSFSF